jgi:hypothetical protein
MTDKDTAMHRGLMKLLNEATYSLKAREVGPFADVYKWAQDIPALIASIEKKKAEPKTRGKAAK